MGEIIRHSKAILAPRIYPFGILLFFFLILSSANITKSEPFQARKDQELQHEVAVTLKLIQVYVTDKDGNPVTNLKKSDFVVYDNKKLQKITDFEQYKLGSPTEKPHPQPELEDIEPSAPLNEFIGRKFFLFFDLANNNTKGFMKAQQAALHFIDTQLQPSDEVSILSFSVLKGLTLHEYFTKDRQAIRNVVKQVATQGQVGRVDNFEAILWRELSGEAPLDASQASPPIMNLGNPDSISPMTRLGRSAHKNIIKRMILKLTDLAKAVRYIPGEKIRDKIGKDAEIFFLVFDEKDNIVELKRQEVEQSVLKGKGALYYSLLPLPPGTYKTSIVMRDIQTGESAVGSDKVEIPKIQEQGLQLVSPLLLAPGKTELYIRGYVPKSIKANFPLLYYFPFDPEQYAPFFGEIPKNTQKIQAVLCCYMRKLTKPALKFEATLIENSSGHESSLPVSILFGTKEGEEAKLLAEFTMPELTVGEYILRITAFGNSSQARSHTAIKLWVY